MTWGLVHAVDERRLGTSLTEDAALGATVLTVEGTTDLTEGKTVLVGTETNTVSSLTDTTVTLETALAAAWPIDTLVLVHPESPERQAYVALDGDEDDIVPARVPHALVPFLPVGVRTPEKREGVSVSENGHYEVTDIPTKYPVAKSEGGEGQGSVEIIYSGDDAGIVFRDEAGNVTIRMDAATGLMKAAPDGTYFLQIGDVAFPLRHTDGTTPKFELDSAGNVTITGKYRTAPSGTRWEMSSSPVNQIQGHIATADTHGYIQVSTDLGGSIVLAPPRNSGDQITSLELDRGTSTQRGMLTIAAHKIEATVGTGANRYTVPRILFKRKAADQTHTANNTTYQSDTDLRFVQVEPNAIYEVTLVLRYTATTVADFQWQIVAPAGCTSVGTRSDLIQGAAAVTDNRQASVDFLSPTPAGGLGTGTTATLHAKGILVVGATGGAVELQWTKNTAEASTLAVLANSYLRLDKLN